MLDDVPRVFLFLLTGAQDSFSFSPLYFSFLLVAGAEDARRRRKLPSTASLHVPHGRKKKPERSIAVES